MIFTQEQRYSQCRECTNTALSPGHRSPLRYGDLFVCWVNQIKPAQKLLLKPFQSHAPRTTSFINESIDLIPT